MKLACILLFLPLYLFAQPDSTFLDYYPLNVGNVWEYEDVFYDSPQNIVTYFRNTITGDTLLQNGNKYKIIRQQDIYPGKATRFLYERIDTTTSRVFRYNSSVHNSEYLLDSLMMHVGDTIRASRNIYPQISSFKCSDIKTASLLGITTTTKEHNDVGRWWVIYYYELAENIGYCYSLDYGLGGRSQTLRYAKISGIEYGTPVNINELNSEVLPEKIELLQNFPNPFNPTTTIEYYLPNHDFIEIELYNTLGQKVAILFSGNQSAGHHQLKIDGSRFSSGVYFYSLETNKSVLTKKCLLMK